MDSSFGQTPDPPAPSDASPAPAEEEILTVNFRCIDGRTFSLELPADIDIADVISLAAEAAEIPESRVRLIYHGRALSTGRTLQSYGAKTGHTIHVVKQQQQVGEGAGGGAQQASSNAVNSPNGESSASGGSGRDARGVGTAPPMWMPISLPGGGTMMVGHMQLPAAMTAMMQGGPQVPVTTAASPSPLPHHSLLASSLSQAVSSVAATMASAAHAAASATSAAQAASNAVNALRGRSGPPGTAAASLEFTATEGNVGRRPTERLSGQTGQNTSERVAETEETAGSSAAAGGDATRGESEGGGSLTQPGSSTAGSSRSPRRPTSLSAFLGGLVGGTGRSEGDRVRSGGQAQQETEAVSASPSEQAIQTGEEEFFVSIATALEGAAHSLLRAAGEVRRARTSQGVLAEEAGPREESRSSLPVTENPRRREGLSPRRDGRELGGREKGGADRRSGQGGETERRAPEASTSDEGSGTAAGAASSPPEGGLSRGDTTSLNPAFFSLHQQPTLMLPGGLTAHVLPVAVHVSMSHEAPDPTAEHGTLGAETSSGRDRAQNVEGGAEQSRQHTAERMTSARGRGSRELMITHDFVQQRLPWAELRQTLEVLGHETGWNSVDLPRVSTRSGAPPPLSVFLPSFFTAVNLVVAMLQQFIGWQQGIHRLSVPTVGRSALALARLSATSARLASLLSSIFNSMVDHVDLQELVTAMAWSETNAVHPSHQQRDLDHSPSASSASLAAVSQAAGSSRASSARGGERVGRRALGRMNFPLSGNGESERRRRQQAGGENEEETRRGRGRRRLERTATVPKKDSVEEEEKKEMERNEPSEERDSEQRWQDVEEEAADAALEEGDSSLPISPSSTSPRASAPSVVSYISSNAATAGSSSSSTDARDAMLAGSLRTSSLGGADARGPTAGTSCIGSASVSPTARGELLSPPQNMVRSVSEEKDADEESVPSSASRSAEQDPFQLTGVARDGREGMLSTHTRPEGSQVANNPLGALQSFLSTLEGPPASRMQNASGVGPAGSFVGDEGTRREGDGEEALNEEVQMRLQLWTGNVQQFSRNVLAYARPRPFSSAYRSGDVTQASSMRLPAVEAVDNITSLTWHRALNRANVGEEPRPPSSLTSSYLTLLMREAATAARSNSDFVMEQDRFPHIQLALQLLDDAERPA